MRLIVLSFNPPEFYGEIIPGLESLRASDAVRVIDAWPCTSRTTETGGAKAAK